MFEAISRGCAPALCAGVGRNTPFLGREFRGRVTHTLVGGKVVFEL